MYGNTSYGNDSRTTTTDVGPVPQGVNLSGIYDLFRRMAAARSAAAQPTRPTSLLGSAGAHATPSRMPVTPAPERSGVVRPVEEGENRFGTFFGGMPGTVGSAYTAWQPGMSMSGGNAPVFMGRW